MTHTLHTGDCREVMAGMADSSIDAIVTDPPYFKVKGEAWDRQWDTPTQFLEWLDGIVAEWFRILRPNGSVYCFASPRMAARVEGVIAGRFNVLNSLVWQKTNANGIDAGWHRQSCKEALRAYFPNTERIIFAEHYGADNIARGEAGYVAKCDELRGFVFEPLRAYLAGERDRAGFTTRQVAEAFQKKTGSRTVTGMAGHWFEAVQWSLPTAENYHWLRELFGGDYLRREYEDLRREYEDLRREYEDLRRPFNVTADVPYTDVWTFPTVSHYPGKHPCEKPVAMLEHIITASTTEGGTVLDCFAGTGSTGVACENTGRKFVGIEREPEYVAIASRRIEAAEQKAGIFAEAV